MRKKKIISFMMEIAMLLTINVIQSVFVLVSIYYFARGKYIVGSVCFLINCVLILKNRRITLEYNT